MSDVKDIGPPRPEWLTELRQHQIDALEAVREAFDGGAKVVFLDAPPGSGKTVLGDEIRRMLGVKATYVCTTKSLQDQVVRDYPYAKLLKGRANYPTEFGGGGVTADDCQDTRGKNCDWCEGLNSCPYAIARMDALLGDLSVLNTAYWLTEANGPGMFSKRPFVIVDECDTMEGALMSFAEFRANTTWLDKGVDVPKKGSHMPTIARWLDEVYATAVEGQVAKLKALGDAKRVRRVQSHLSELAWVVDEIRSAVTEDEGELAGAWIRDNDAGPLVLKPVQVARYGRKLLWRHADRFVFMSGTVISADEMAQSLGLDLPYAWVQVPMTFAVENRPIYMAPIADTTYAASKAGARPEVEIAKALQVIANDYAGERILVHTVSYHLARKIAEEVKRLGGFGRRVFTYQDAEGRNEALKRYSATPGAMMLAPSLDRGYDFAGDLARVVVIAKIPFMALGDRQVSARLHRPGGRTWYDVNTVRSIVQMSGRGVRSADDWAHTFILDKGFPEFMSKTKRLWPKWWLDAIDRTYPVGRLRAA